MSLAFSIRWARSDPWSILQQELSLSFIGILNLECAVRPPGRSNVAYPMKPQQGLCDFQSIAWILMFFTNKFFLFLHFHIQKIHRLLFGILLVVCCRILVSARHLDLFEGHLFVAPMWMCRNSTPPLPSDYQCLELMQHQGVGFPQIL